MNIFWNIHYQIDDYLHYEIFYLTIFTCKSVFYYSSLSKIIKKFIKKLIDPAILIFNTYTFISHIINELHVYLLVIYIILFIFPLYV